MLDKQFLGSSGKIVCTGNLNEWFGIKVEFASFFCHTVRMISMLVEKALIALHFLFKPWNVDANEGVVYVGGSFCRHEHRPLLGCCCRDFMMQSASQHPLFQPNIHALDASALMHERSCITENPP